MTINQAIRILDQETTAEELAAIEYYGGLHGHEKMWLRARKPVALRSEL